MVILCILLKHYLKMQMILQITYSLIIMLKVKAINCIAITQQVRIMVYS